MHVDLFDILYEDTILNYSNVFKKLDEFTVFCFYIEEIFPSIEIEIGINMRSCLREQDLSPSFRLYYNQDTLVFTDYGQNNLTGNVVKFVAELFGVNKDFALEKICADFGITNKIKEAIPIRKQSIPTKKKLAIKTKEFTVEGLAFWESFHITPITLKNFNVFEIDWILWDTFPIKPKFISFGYRIGNHWKVYSPFEPNYKFTTNYPRNYVEGLLTLKYTKKLLIIGKSLKDSMVLKELGYDSISPKSESTVINRAILVKLEAKYKKIVVFFDNDLRHNAHLYPYPLIMLPLPGPKDISDYVKEFGVLKGRKIMLKLLKSIEI